MWPKYSDRKTALSKYEDQWKHDVSVKSFGLTRSVGIVEEAEKANAKSIPHGMAALISQDGYALTANHVVYEDTPGMIATHSKNTFIPAHMGTARMVIRNTKGQVTMQRDLPGLSGYKSYANGEEKKIEIEDVVIRPIRIIKRFKSIDLALIKTDITTSDYFEFSDHPSRKTILFTSGNPFRYRASAAGEIKGMSKKSENAHSIYTSIPLSPGDSGSPVFDHHGRLVGLTTNAYPKGFFIFPASIIRRIEPQEIIQLIANDRANAKK